MKFNIVEMPKAVWGSYHHGNCIHYTDGSDKLMCDRRKRFARKTYNDDYYNSEVNCPECLHKIYKGYRCVYKFNDTFNTARMVYFYNDDDTECTICLYHSEMFNKDIDTLKKIIFFKKFTPIKNMLSGVPSKPYQIWTIIPEPIR